MMLSWETVPEQQITALLSVPRSVEHLDREREKRDRHENGFLACVLSF